MGGAEAENLNQIMLVMLQDLIHHKWYANASVVQAMMQVCLHSHGHRAQCAVRLRLLGGTPPNMDFILWLKERPAPNWE